MIRPCFSSQFAIIIIFVLLFSLPFLFIVPVFRFGGYGILGFFVYFALLLMAGIRACFIWYRTAFIITSQRIIDIDCRGFFHKVVSEADLEKIQDASFHKKGFWQTLFNYGVIDIQSAGTKLVLEMSGVKDPQKIHHLINELKNIRIEVTRLKKGSADNKNLDFSAMLDQEIIKHIKKIKEEIGESRFSKIVRMVNGNF